MQTFKLGLCSNLGQRRKTKAQGLNEEEAKILDDTPIILPTKAGVAYGEQIWNYSE